MTDQKPDAGDNNPSNDNEATPPETEEVETAAEQPDEADAEAPEEAGSAESAEDPAPEADDAAADEGEQAEPEDDAAAADEAAAADVVAETEAEAADAAAAGAAWTTTPVAPDPEATEAALAALAAKPEITLEPPETPPPPPPGDEEDEGTPVLLVGGILVGAFIVALAIVLILFRPFDNLVDPDASLSPSPVVTEQPSESPSAIATVDTPNFQGLPLETAESTATDYGLVVRVNPVETDEVEPGTVLGQEPGPGEPVEEGSTIELSVAQAVPTNSVPDVTGLDEDEATEAVEDAGFVVGDMTFEFSDDVPAGSVISTEPAVDSELPVGTQIDLVISDGPETVSVPDLTDQTEAAALDLLDAAGLAPGERTEAFDETIVAGNVISSDPATDAEVSPGSAVAYVISLGVETVSVPDLTDQTEAAALDLLDAAGLAPGERTEAFDETIVAGNVISSDPATDAEVSPGSAVDYVISLGVETVSVPDLTDQTEAAALDLLDAAGLAPGERTEAFDETIVAGNVISSDPATDAEVSPGSAVAYVISLGVETVSVPDLTDQTEAAALDLLDAAGLAPGERTEAFDETIVAGNVISSDPATDAEVSPGSAVAYVISLGVETVSVPDLTDQTEADALDLLDAAGLAPGERTEAFDETIVAGNVISSDPATDAEVSPGSAVAYVISLGVETVSVPDLTDQTEADALDLLDAAGLAPGERTEAFDETIVAGNVISSDPATDAEVSPGSAVAYVISLGVETVAVPDLSGAAADAADTIAAAGLTLGEATQDYSDTVALGDVISQAPSAGTEVELGTAVSYVESLGVQQVAVPDLTGPAAEADQKITDAGFVVGVTFEVNSDTVPAGDVNDQNPIAGQMAPVGSEIDYTISIGPEQVEVPDLSGAAADAPDTLAAAGLSVGEATQAYSDTVALGDVIGQSPAAGESVDVGSAVAYVISLGVETVAVPDLSGAAADAADTIAAAGLTLGEATQDYSDTVALGDVISQAPSAGTEVELGTAVSYVESLGVQQVAVPDLTGPAAEADQKITDAGFVVGVTFEVNSDTVPAGDVNDQNPIAGQMAPVGSEIDYTISIGPEQVEVPDLSGAAADAPDTLAAAGLSVGEATQAYSDTVALGDVIGQSPAAGESVDVGSAVAYVISLGVETVAVPDLSGAAADAADTIAAAGLTLGEATQDYSDTVALGDVISQAPSAGTEVELGTAVSYVESLGVQQVAVPDLTGPAAEADQKITDAGFVVGVTFEVNSDTVPAGDVNDQNPIAGQMAPVGSEIDYTISIGPEQVEVPDLSGAAADAPDTLAAAGLSVGEATQAYSDTVALGDVIGQSPAAGESVDVGSAVAYVISLGVETVAVPDLSGAAADAADTIAAAGLTLGEATQDYSDTVALGDVISQAPSAGTEVELGTAVSYVESLGVQQVAVPDLTGPAAEADQKITDAGFVVGVTFEVNSDTVPAGDVNDQNPIAGQMAPVGSEIDYTISIGPEQVEVPDLSGAAADAPDTLAAAGLSVGEATQAYSDTVALGDVIGQSPAAGESVDVGSAVAYVISLGVETVAVPDLSGAAADAADTIAAAGLTLGEATQDYSDTVALGDVISQAPSAGTEVELGTAVSYVESLGVQQVAVPAVRELSQEDATATIEAAGLTVGEVLERNHANVPAGAALRTDPAEGEMVDIGSAVSLFMSIGPEQVEVPDVVGMAEADAIAAIEAAKLVPGSSSDEYSDTIRAGSVISTSPAAGTTLDADSAVDYVLSLGVEQVAVPEVVDLPEADAVVAIEAAGLQVGEMSNAFDEDIAEGNVVSENPASGTEIDKGSSVDLVVSDGPTPFVSIPAVRDLPEADAVAAIEGANLVVGETIYRTHEGVAEGAAIKTEPQASEEILHGEPVELYVSTGSKFRTIPDVSGQEAVDAQAALQAEDLAVVLSERNNANYPAGQAVKTEPAAGAEVEVGDEVTLVVSKGIKQVDVPDVVGQTRADARTAITDAELEVGDETVVEDSAAKNTVIAQDPAPGGQADKNSTVDITVSSGPPQVVVPAVRDVAAAEARSTLESLGLVVETKEVFHANVAAGDAIKTDPAEGTPADIGSTVTMNISKGPKPVSVPDVVGSKKGAATTAIEDAGLVVGEQTTVEDPADKNTVLAQDPAADAEVATGSAVNLTISSGPPSEDIPEVRDVPAAEAQAQLESLGYVVETKEVFHANVAAGDAIKTDPPAGETVGVGSTVTMNVSKGPKPVSVPDVVGSKKGAATTAIEDAGLVVGEQTTVEDPADKNTVLAQDPAADAEVATGSAVNLTISSGPPSEDIPEVRDVPAAEAQAQLESLGYVVETKEVFHANVAAGDAIKTDPPAGETVGVGSTVTMNVSKGPKPVFVPDVVGSKQGAATTAIEDAGLVVGEQTTVEDAADKNTVLAQDPAADSEVATGSAVNLTISSGPPQVTIPEVRDVAQARAVNDLESLGLMVETKEVFHAKVAAGDAIKTDPAAGETVDLGSTVTMNVSQGIKQVTVPNLVSLAEDDVEAALTGAELKVGTRSETENEAAPGTVVDQSPAEGATVDKNSTVDYTVSTGPAVEPMGLGGDLANTEVMSQLDTIASEIEPIRELGLSNTPYDGSNSRQHELALAERIDILRDADAIKAEERALKRLGLLSNGDDLAALLETLYGQALPAAYYEDDGHLSVLEGIDQLDASERAQAARELDRALTDQNFGLESTRVGDKSRGDAALAGYALEQGDGTAAMLDWSAASGSNSKTNEIIVPGDDGIFESMPLILQREYSLPFLEGRIFVDRLQDDGGWGAVNAAWNRPPESTEQILHPKLYPDERPTSVVMEDIAGQLGGGWSEDWQQTMGELRIGVWLADGADGEQSGPKAAVKLPRANAAAGWGGDRLVSLGGPDGQWAIVWQTKWDTEQDIDQFENAANKVLAGLDGAGLVAPVDVSGGVSNPALVIVADGDDTLASVADALGVVVTERT